jgi:ATP-dependent RNA helicase DDX23/PRP28
MIRIQCCVLLWQQAAALQRLEERRQQSSSAAATADKAAPDDGEKERARERARASERERARAAEAARSGASSSNGATMGGVTDRAREKELQEIRDSYLGKKLKKKNIVKPSEKFSKIFQFDWEAGDDTSNDLNPIYSSRMAVQPLFGRGYIAGVDLQEQRRQSAFNKTLIEKRQAEERQAELEGGTLTAQEIQDRERARRRVGEELREAEAARNKKLAESGSGLKGKHWKEKELGDMNERDWRIFREDYDIVVRGGRAPLPMRDWTEAKEIPELLLKAIEDLKYKEPSPIQRQAIPIGLQWRDIIGIAETGSGKVSSHGLFR